MAQAHRYVLLAHFMLRPKDENEKNEHIGKGRFMQYNEEIMELDRIYQKEQTEQNELKLEKLKVKFWMEKLKENPDDKEILKSLEYHQEEVTRLEKEVKLV